MLRFVGPQNTAKVEEEVRHVVKAPGESLQLPVHPKEWWLGGELGLIELIITWARLSDRGALVTYIAPDEDPTTQLAAMARRLFGFVALLMAPEIVDRKGVPKDNDTSTNPAFLIRSLRREAYDQCRQVVEMMFRPVSHFTLGSKVFLVCVDHSTLSMIPSLYTPTETVGDRIAFITLARELLAKLAPAFPAILYFRTPRFRKSVPFSTSFSKTQMNGLATTMQVFRGGDQFADYRLNGILGLMTTLPALLRTTSH